MLTRTLSIYAAEGTWVVRAEGAVLGESSRAIELVDGDFPPVIYFPREDLGMPFLEPSETKALSPEMGEARYFHIAGPDALIRDAGWSYEAPSPTVARIAGHIAFHPGKVTVERV